VQHLRYFLFSFSTSHSRVLFNRNSRVHLSVKFLTRAGLCDHTVIFQMRLYEITQNMIPHKSPRNSILQVFMSE